jgi:hypothetical protein
MNRAAELQSLLKSLERHSARAAAVRDQEHAAYYPWSPPSSASSWIAKVAARRYRLALWVLGELRGAS